MPTIYRRGQCIDHYEIIDLLGGGGASSVYLACDQETQQSVVLKFPKDEEIGGAAIFASYLREEELGRQLIHPSILPHLNQGEERSRKYLVLEYLQGRTLRAAVQALSPALLPLAEVVRIMLHLCNVLIYVHKQGVIHQDIKPENIFLLDTGEIKLLDFGIATFKKAYKRHPHVWLRFSSPVGTPAYMSPERLRGERGNERSDVYAVGVVLYELLCGQTPFLEEDGFTLVNAHISHDPPDILKRKPELSPELATVVMQAIRRNPDKRHTSIQALQHDLSFLDQVTPVEYIPDPPLLGGRYRQIWRLAAIILLISLLIVSFGILAQFAHHGVR